MEKTFVDSFVEHAMSGLFRPGHPNVHAVMCSLYDVNKRFGTKVTFEWAQTRVQQLQEQYHLFRWVVNTEGVIWNQRLAGPPVVEVAPDGEPDAAATEAVLIEAANEEGPSEPLNEALHAVADPTNAIPHLEVVYVFDSSSSSMWRALEEYHGSNSDVDSVLPPPGVPLSLYKRAKVAHPSPPSERSAGASSSTASNATPLKTHM
ncbi:hypothetical protein Salat_0668100 [Sesamum alatum]|uniref:Myb/SANT-like domain-containing protein n=1 Tax=Sesamum alatum TaxID=300844 RepID=A0AAE2CUX6_9LAMI|nr:hypothetical protein Salat_0668100 [Sesamum alatum]